MEKKKIFEVVKVEDGLPKDSEHVFVTTKSGGLYGAYYVNHLKQWIIDKETLSRSYFYEVIEWLKETEKIVLSEEQFKSLQSAKGYSQEDMRKCFEAGRDYQRDVDYDEDECPDFDDYLTTIKPAG